MSKCFKEKENFADLDNMHCLYDQKFITDI